MLLAVMSLKKRDREGENMEREWQRNESVRTSTEIKLEKVTCQRVPSNLAGDI